MKCLSIVKRLAVAAVAAATLIGPVTAAHALTFGAGDAVLAIYGNNTEYVKNLGSFTSLLSTGIDLDLSSILSQVSPNGPAGANTIKYTLVGNNSATDIFFGDAFAASTWSTAQKNGVVVPTYSSALSNWSGPLGLAADAAKTLYAATDPLSFSSNLNGSGNESLGGSIPSTRRGSADIDTILQLLQRTGAANTLATVGTASLSSVTGHFVINPSAVPVPAAVVLFGTGLIGLVGVARRRVMGLQ